MSCLAELPIYGVVPNPEEPWGGGARSVLAFPGDHFWGFEVTRASVGVIIGLNDVDESTGPLEVEHGFYISKGTFRVIENGIYRGPSAISYDEGDRFYIVRVGQQVLYMLRPDGTPPGVGFTVAGFDGRLFPGELVYASNKPSNGTAFLDATFYAVDDQVFNETGGAFWAPVGLGGGGESGAPDFGGLDIGGFAAAGAGALLFTGFGVADLPATSAHGTGELTFSVEAGGSAPVGAAGELIFTGLGADVPLETIGQGELTFSCFGGEAIFPSYEGASGVLVFTCTAGGSSGSVGGSGELPFVGFGVGGDILTAANEAIGYGELAFAGTALGSTVPNAPTAASFQILLSLYGAPDPLAEFSEEISEQITVAAEAHVLYALSLLERVLLSSPTRTFYQTAVELLDSAGAAPSVELAVVTFITETYNISDTLTYRQALQIAEALAAEGRVETVYHGFAAVLSAILVGDGGGSGSTGATGGGTVVDGTGSENLFPAGSVITVTYETDTGGTTTISTTLAEDSTAQEVAVIIAALLDDEPDISAVATGDGAIEISPAGGATTVLITGSTGGGAVTDPTGDAGDPADIVYTSDPADILLTGWFPAGSTVTVTYSTDTGGTDSVTFTVTQDSTAAQVAEQIAALLDAQDDIAAIHTGGGAIEVTPEGGASTVTIVSVNVTTPSLTGDPGIGAIAAYSKTVAETVSVADALAYLFQMLAVLTDGVGAADTLQNVLTITVLETAEVEVDDTLELSAQYFGSLLDRVEVLAMIKTPAEMAQGWVMNTEGAMPISEYDNYVFKSLAYSPDEMLGCTDQGLYILDGENDAGANIDAQLTSLMLDFKTSKLKRMSTAYLGYRSNGQLLLKVRSVEQGVHAERWYEARSTDARTSPGQNRMKIGKGLRSRYWTFELVNVDGSDFELDKVELYPIVLDRRI